ncbi:MAG: type VI secretion system tip protein VgrG [Myxococcales bacterium]|nr:type VI secretion system tip protein VgrG [Myxococcales bacterium]
MRVDAFSLGCAALPEAAFVGFKGTERLCRPFELEVFFTVPVGTDPCAALGAPASLTLVVGEDRDPMVWHGIFAVVTLLHETAERALYSGLLVPRLWLLGNSVRSQVHTKEKLDAFVGQTLEDGGLAASDYRFEIDTGSYPEEEFVCQYRETHLAFVHRWLEREGAYYYFEHEPADGGRDIVVFVDDKGQHQPLPGAKKLRYVPQAGPGRTTGQALRELSWDYASAPATVLLTDYNYATPAAAVEGEGTVAPHGKGQLRSHGYRVFEAAEAKRLADVKAQSIGCRTFVVRGRGNVTHLRAGYTFELEDPPADSIPGKLLAIELRHAGALSGATAEVRRLTGLDAGETYRVEFEAIDAAVQFRAPQQTPWPRIHGCENAVIDGPAKSPYAQLDDDGRYLVRFHFDASDLGDAEASTYLRMMQPHGGTIEGHHFPLRKGTEVMVGFQGGDPDRPFIAAAVPNAERPSTVTKDNDTENVLRTGGANHMVLEDDDGKQYLHLFSPTKKSQTKLGGPQKWKFYGFKGSGPTEVPCSYLVTTEGNAGYSVGGGWWEDILGDKNVHVKGDVTLDDDVNLKTEIGATAKETVHGNRVETTTGTTSQTFQSAQLVRSKATRLDDVAGGTHTLTRKSTVVDFVAGTWKQTVTGAVTENFGPQVTLVVGQTKLDSKTNIDLKAGGAIVMIGSDVSAKGSVQTEWYVPDTLELFGNKNSLTAVKAEAVAMSLALTGAKKEYVKSSNAVVGVKIDVTGTKKEYAGTTKYVGVGKGEGLSLRSWKTWVGIFTFGLVKL